jgi:hypothetical protein
VFDNPNNAASNLAQVDDAGLGFVGSLAPTQHPDLLDVCSTSTTRHPPGVIQPTDTDPDPDQHPLQPTTPTPTNSH